MFQTFVNRKLAYLFLFFIFAFITCVIQIIGKLDGNGNIESSTKLNHKDVLEKSQNEHNHDITIRKARRGGKRQVFGSGGNNGNHNTTNTAKTSSAGTHFCVLTFILCFSYFLLIILFV